MQHGIDTFISKTNSITVNFLTNTKYDAPGFKMFYTDGKML